MALGPIEVLVIEFPGSQFNGEMLPELERLVHDGTVSIVDGLFLLKGDDGEVAYFELSQVDSDANVARLASLLDQVESLISDEVVAELSDGLRTNSSAAILAFEHAWAKPLHDAVVGSGGALTTSFRVPGTIVDELLDELAAID